MQTENNERELLERLAKAEADIEKYKALCEQKDLECQESAKRRRELSEERIRIITSRSWRWARPLRAVKPALSKFRIIKLPYKVIKNIKQNGFGYTLRKIKGILGMRKLIRYDERVLAEERSTEFEKRFIFSVIVPLYNTPKQYLEEMIGSVLWQTYPGWELCLADGSDAEHAYVGEYCRSLAEKDSRIKYKVLEKNFGISGNTNAAIEMSTGDYIALFDHDDKLHPSALFEMMRAALDGADFIYTDEAKFLKNEMKDAYDFFFKPDFSPDMLRSCNYITHFSAFSRELYNKVGGFRSQFDGSQDYDIILRLTEKAKKVAHIPKLLYFWRCHAESVASNIQAKPYCLTSAHGALEDHLKRLGLVGDVEDSVGLSTYRIRYEIAETPLVSVIVISKGKVEWLERTLKAVFEATTYKNKEIILVGNADDSDDMLEFYKAAQTKYEGLRLVAPEKRTSYPARCNLAMDCAVGEYAVFIDGACEPTTPRWIEELLMLEQRNDVFATGLLIYRDNKTVEHSGIVVGIHGFAGYVHEGFPLGSVGYFGRMSFVQNYSAVSSKLMMVKTALYRELGGFDEGYKEVLADVDLCLRGLEKGYVNIFTPYATACLHGVKGRKGSKGLIDERVHAADILYFKEKNEDALSHYDPYYNPNLTMERDDYSLRFQDAVR